MPKKKKLKKAELELQCAEYLSGWKRALADYENIKSDLASQKSDARKQIKIGFALDLLPVLDNFDQAITHAPTDLPKKYQTWLQGVTYIEKQFREALTGLGVTRIEVGDAFDPDEHESVGEGEEMKEVKSGWKIDDHVIRPAQVIIKNK